MAKQFVPVKVIRRNDYEYSALQSLNLNALNVVVEVTQWRVPTADMSGRHNGFKYVDGGGAKPTADSVKVLRINDVEANEIFYVPIGDADTAEVFADVVNGDVADMPAVTLPAILNEEYAVYNSTTSKYEVFQYTRALEAGEEYFFSGSKDGVALPAPDAGGYASLAAFKTWADTNWAAAGATVTVSGTKVTLGFAAAVTTASITIEVKPAV